MALHLSTEPLPRASARRPWLVVAAWGAVFAVSVALIFNLLSDALTNEFGFTGNPDSKRADTLLEERLRGPQEVNEIVIVRSADRRTTILPFVMAGDEAEADENIDDVLAVVHGADGVEGFQVLITGGASVNNDFQEVAGSDLQSG